MDEDIRIEIARCASALERIADALPWLKLIEAHLMERVADAVQNDSPSVR